MLCTDWLDRLEGVPRLEEVEARLDELDTVPRLDEVVG